MMIEKLLAGLLLALCVIMLLRLCVRDSRRRQIDEFGQHLLHLPARLLRRSQASREAAEAIRRAKGAGNWRGNVYTPKSFKRPRKPH